MNNGVENLIRDMKINNKVLNDNYLISEIYQRGLDKTKQKDKGIYYTPKIIVDYIISNTIKSHNIIKNPYLKILDISCGCGNFLLEVYDVLYSMFKENLDNLKMLYGDKYFNEENIHNHIISNCIYGADIDKDAINILKESLILKNPKSKVDKINIVCCDSLKNYDEYEELNNIFNNRYDYIIGNPPYIGHKGLDKDYKKWLLTNYKDVYKDKSDIYYCFYKRILELLGDSKVASIITPRYFIESPSGKLVRNYIKENSYIEEIIDFYGFNIFKNVGVASCIITFKNKKEKNENIKVHKMQKDDVELEQYKSLKEILYTDCFENINCNQKDLKDKWILANTKDIELYFKIQNKAQYKLEDICESFQGIITGCDKAFVLKENEENHYKIEEDILKPWIKNKNIDKFIVNDSDYKLIYSNDITCESKYKNTIKYISEYRQKLEKRRECLKNSRKWYELQWGREKRFFEKEKIIFPYKGKENKFAIDKENRYFSADIYSLYIKDEYKDMFSYEYIIALLNSSTYDKYFKLYAKKMSRGIYDYYPNTVMDMKIFKDENYFSIERLSKEIIKIYEKEDLNEKDINQIDKMKEEIEILIIKTLELSKLIEA